MFKPWKKCDSNFEIGLMGLSRIKGCLNVTLLGLAFLYRRNRYHNGWAPHVLCPSVLPYNSSELEQAAILWHSEIKMPVLSCLVKRGRPRAVRSSRLLTKYRRHWTNILAPNSGLTLPCESYWSSNKKPLLQGYSLNTVASVCEIAA